MLKSLVSRLWKAPTIERARALRKRDDATQAEAVYRALLAREPERADAHRELADLVCLRGAADEALRHAKEALRLRPHWADAHNSAGLALYAQSRLDEAIAHFRAALAAEADCAPAHVNLANALVDLGEMDAALGHYREALAHAPQDATAHLAFATALEDDGRYAEALASYERALALAPSDGVRIKIATMLPMFPASSQEIDALRERMAGALDALMAKPLRLQDPAREVGQTAFLLAYQGRNDRDLQRRLAALYEHACPELLYAAPHCGAPRPARAKLRVGFCSAYFTSHSVGVWFNRLIALVAAEPDLEVVLIDLGGRADAELRAACARTLEPPRDLAQARAAVAALELDILVHADIGMDPFGYFLAFSRLAPVQCAMLGHPVTSGLRNIDYFISSALFEREDAQAHYSERLVRLNSLPLYFPRPLPPSPAKGRRELGLPEDRTLYACPMMLHKFHHEFDGAMASILRRDPRAEILLFRDARFPHRHESLLRRFAAAHGDVAERLRVRPWASADDLLNILRESDVVIDTFHFSAGTTAFLVLAMGTPIVTLPADYVRGRPTYGCYLKMGMLDCVAGDPADYVELALRIGTDRALRDDLRRKILDKCGTLYSDRAVVAELAGFLRSVASSPATRSTTGAHSA